MLAWVWTHWLTHEHVYFSTCSLDVCHAGHARFCSPDWNRISTLSSSRTIVNPVWLWAIWELPHFRGFLWNPGSLTNKGIRWRRCFTRQPSLLEHVRMSLLWVRTWCPHEVVGMWDYLMWTYFTNQSELMLQNSCFWISSKGVCIPQGDTPLGWLK